MKCAVKKCEKNAMVLYGSSWVCGECCVKLLEKERQERVKRVEEMEI